MSSCCPRVHYHALPLHRAAEHAHLAPPLCNTRSLIFSCLFVCLFVGVWCVQDAARQAAQPSSRTSSAGIVAVVGVGAAEMEMPYDASTLHWDEAHLFNSEDVYCYCGRGADRSTAMLACHVCSNLFHQRAYAPLALRLGAQRARCSRAGCTSQPAHSVLLADRAYRFVCRHCNNGTEQFTRHVQVWQPMPCAAPRPRVAHVQARCAHVTAVAGLGADRTRGDLQPLGPAPRQGA